MVDMQNILVLGAYGFLGEGLSRYLVDAGYTVYRQSRNKSAQTCIDPFNVDQIESVVLKKNINCIVNLIALTSVDLCEKEIGQSYKVNVGIVEAIVKSMDRLPDCDRPHLITISTDHVYSGKGPHTEDIVAPCNIYALSKLAGEYVASQAGATIFRTNFIGKSYSEKRVSLTDWIVNSIRFNKTITVYEDVLFSPLHISTLCSMIELAIVNKLGGIYNLGSSDGDSKASLSYKLADCLSIKSPKLVRGKLAEQDQDVVRPFDMRMDSSKFECVFDCSLPTFESQVLLAANDYKV